MAGKEKGNPDTNLLLGEIKGAVKAVDQKLGVQNGAINHLRESVNGLSSRIDNLPCEVHAERITNIVKAVAKEDDKETQQERDKKRARRELLIAFVAAALMGVFTLIGVWLSQGG